MKLVIVGGGTAGWLTALYVQKVFSDHEITLIESEDIGILGAGEGTTPSIYSLLNFLDIHPANLIQSVGATIKNGIKFNGWAKDDSYFFHPFLSEHSLSNDYNYNLTYHLERDTHYSHMLGAESGHNLNDYSFISKLSDLDKVPFELKDQGYVPISNWAVHFDARRLASLLKSIGETRKIKRIEGKVSIINNDDNGNITSLQLENGRQIQTDFIFDCTGFARLFIGKHFEAEWKSHSDRLPAKKALPFFMPIQKSIPPYTESISFDCGWMWKIPTQERYGCGYVFDSDFISEEEAAQEIERKIGFEPIYPRQDKGAFKFNAGCYKEIWIKNCLALGLSSGFIEPLEATSIMQMTVVLDRFLSNPLNVTCNSKKIKDYFNKLYLDETENVVDFIYLHYVTTKKTTRFWSEFTKNNKMPDFVEYILEVIQHRPLLSEDFKGRNFFHAIGYSYVLIGNGLWTEEILKKHTSYIRNIDEKRNTYFEILKRQFEQIHSFPHHNLILDLFGAPIKND